MCTDTAQVPSPTPSAQVPSPTPSPQQLGQLHDLLGGHRVSQAIYVVARLGIADLLASGPKDDDELARDTGTHTTTLRRVLRFLASVGLFDEISPHRFALTTLGAGLRSDVPGSRRPWALMLLAPSEWQAWADLLHTVQTGQTAFDHVHGTGKFEYLHQHADEAAIFQAAMSAGVEASSLLTQTYDFCTFKRVVDVGGGRGTIMATVLRACASTRGVLFDRPEALVEAAVVLGDAGVADRCEIVGGDFFTGVPPDGDAYILRQIVHDWGDPQAVQILRHCRAAIRPDGRLLVIERAIAPNVHEARSVLDVDMQMLVSMGGMQRTDAEYDQLFSEAGFRLTNIVPLNDTAQFSILKESRLSGPTAACG